MKTESFEMVANRGVCQRLLVLLALMIGLSTSAFADHYRIDMEGAHVSVNFKIKHLGYSWLTGRFNKMQGSFDYDEKNPGASKINMSVHTASVDSNHAERDKHLRGKKYLHVKKYPIATFVSSAFVPTGKNTANVKGVFTLHGVAREIEVPVKQIGAGKDPWLGFRRGFESSFVIRLNDYGIKHDLGAASETLHLDIYVEGILDQKYLTE